MSSMDALPVPKARYTALNSQQGSQQDITYSSSLPTNSQDQPLQWQVEKRMSGGQKTIIIAVLCIIVPMLGLAGLLIGLVLGYRVDRRQGGLDGPLTFTQRSDSDDDAYYVNFNATTLATIASWSSTVAPLLAVAALALYSYPISKRLKEHSQTHGRDLPTPFQFGLLLEALSGSITAFFSLGAYLSWKSHQKMVSMLRSSFIVLLVATIIGYAVAGVDTWLHLVMDTVEIDIPTARAPARDFGRVFHNTADSSCTNQTGAFDVRDCTVKLAVTNTFLTGSNEAYRVLQNLSSVNTVRFTDVGGKIIAYSGPATVPDDLDFQASTVGLHTQCQAVSKECNLIVTSGASTNFKCSDEFFGNLAVPEVNGDDGQSGQTGPSGAVLYGDSALTKNLSSTEFSTKPQNPIYLGAWGVVQIVITDQQDKDPNYVVPMHGGVAWVLSCSSTAYDLTYSWVNGTVTNADAKVANGSTNAILQSAIFWGFGGTYMENAAYGASAQDHSEDTAASWALQYSRTAMGLSSGMLDPAPTLTEQTRKTVLVSRVPKVPLYFLVALNILYAIFGVILACIALASFPSETNDVRERLSYAGLVAYCFEGAQAKRPVEKKRQLFAEHDGDGSARIGIERGSYEGWEYTKRQELKKTEYQEEVIS